jgi:hypothetical protein
MSAVRVHLNAIASYLASSLSGAGHERADRAVDQVSTTGCVAMLALIAGTVSYLHMHMLVELHGQPRAGSRR